MPDSFLIMQMFATDCSHKRRRILTTTWFRHAESFIDVTQHASPRQCCSISSIICLWDLKFWRRWNHITAERC